MNLIWESIDDEQDERLMDIIATFIYDLMERDEFEGVTISIDAVVERQSDE